MRGRTALAIVIASAAVIVAVAAVFVVPGSGTTVTVNAVNLVGWDTCDVNQSAVGFSASPGAVEHFSGQVLNDGQGNCTIQSIRSNTPGFTVITASVPLFVPPGVRTLTWLVQLPLFFNGNLTLNFTGMWSPANPTYPSNSTCPSPCFSSGVPSQLYFYTFGEVLPSGWIIMEAGSLGTLFGAVLWARTRQH